MYQRSDNGRWVFRVTETKDGTRKRVGRERTTTDEATARQWLAEYRASLPAYEPPTPRLKAMRQARDRGSHTPAELRALRRARPESCPGCGVRLDGWNDAVDHIIPVSKGGSDAIDNLQLLCWMCNHEKSDLLDWTYDGPERTYAPRPSNRMDPVAMRRAFDNYVRFGKK